MVRRVSLIVFASIVAVGCGGHRSTPRRTATSEAPRAAPAVVGPGRLVSIGRGRSLYLYCVGRGTPTVLLEAGFGGNTDTWNAVQPQLGQTTRTCAYDRAGLGNSLPVPGVHDAGDEIGDLQQLLKHARVPAPYVLVGHSYGGLLARVFADAHPSATAGVVLIDAVGRSQEKRYLALWRAQPRLRGAIPKPAVHVVDSGVDLSAGETLADHVTTLRSTPLAVITRGRPPDEDRALPPTAQRELEQLWTRMQDELAGLSANHVHVVAARSRHFVQGFSEGQPGVVIRAVRAVIDAARARSPLPACPRLFHGPGVRCRS